MELKGIRFNVNTERLDDNGSGKSGKSSKELKNAASQSGRVSDVFDWGMWSSVYHQSSRQKLKGYCEYLVEHENIRMRQQLSVNEEKLVQLQVLFC